MNTRGLYHARLVLYPDLKLRAASLDDAVNKATWIWSGKRAAMRSFMFQYMAGGSSLRIFADRNTFDARLSKVNDELRDLWERRKENPANAVLFLQQKELLAAKSALEDAMAGVDNGKPERTLRKRYPNKSALEA